MLPFRKLLGIICGVVLFGFGFVGELIAGMRAEQRELLRLRHPPSEE